jgi:hypothetical protein
MTTPIGDGRSAVPYVHDRKARPRFLLLAAAYLLCFKYFRNSPSVDSRSVVSDANVFR